ncbi:MAG TPA: hypothetical protein VFY92_11440 [Hyphomicrobiaceae bacterium]|nr:hypothetical protein [Hyphomicrobiaceae bacterium]
MNTEAQTQPRPKPLPPKKRYCILLSHELAERFERVARQRHGAKSAVIEEALDRRLNPEKYPLIGDALLRRLDEQSKSIATLKRDAVIVAEMLSLFVRYFLTITPPLGEREQQPARALGKERFQVFVAQIGRRLTSDRRVVADVLESIAVHNPDLLTHPGRRQAAQGAASARDRGRSRRHRAKRPFRTFVATGELQCLRCPDRSASTPPRLRPCPQAIGTALCLDATRH